MKGIVKMFSGQGEKEYQAQHKKFRDAIPDVYPPGLTIAEKAEMHPAYSGPLAHSLDAENYRTAHFGGKGPQSKAEHAAFAEYQRTHTPDGQLIREEVEPRRSFVERLIQAILPE